MRLGFVACVAALGAPVAFFADVFSGSDNFAGGDPASGLFMMLVFAGIVWFFAFVPAILAGAALHLLLRRYRLPRVVVLVVFALSAAIVLRVFYMNLQFVWHLAAVVVVLGWLAYCFGPLSLWSYSFDRDRDVDF